MVEVLAKVTFASTSGLPKDAVNNDLSFDAANILAATLDGIAASIESFYNDANTTQPLSAYIGEQISRAANAHSVDFYDVSGALDGGPAGSPIHTVPFSIGAPTAGVNFPAEVACKVTFYADGWDDVPETAVNPTPPPATIRPRARFRGGIYLGPLNADSAVGTTTTEPRPSADFITNIDAAAFRFMDERGGDFCVWSRTDEIFRLVAPGGRWTVDDAYDTIRKRGRDATARSVVWP